VLADEHAGVEVTQLEVGVVGAQLAAQLVASGVGEAAYLSGHPARLLGEVGQAVGTEDKHRHEGDEHELLQTDPEHGSEPTRRREA
jgi:hypothetical protein